MKKNNKKWESLAWIIVGIFILSVVMIWVWNIIGHSREVVSRHNDATNIFILKKNTENIISKLDLSLVNVWEKFYLNKNLSSKNFEVFTGSLNENYKYVNANNNNISDINAYDFDDIYSREITIKEKKSYKNIFEIDIKKVSK